jgi:RNA polymerase sigma-70 factor (ECF subfamily)
VSDTTTGPPAESEDVCRANVVAVTSYFARRSADPQSVGDLTSDTVAWRS